MQAYWIAPGPGGTKVELRDTPVPEPKPGELLVRGLIGAPLREQGLRITCTFTCCHDGQVIQTS